MEGLTVYLFGISLRDNPDGNRYWLTLVVKKVCRTGNREVNHLPYNLFKKKMVSIRSCSLFNKKVV